MDPFADDASLDPIARVQRWAEPVGDPTPTVELPIQLSLNPPKRILAIIIVVLGVAGAWGALHYVGAGSWDPVVGFVLALCLLAAGISFSVSSITLDHKECTEVGAWRIETVPLSSMVRVRHRDDMVALVTDAGLVKFIGPLRDRGSNTLSHGLPEGATAAGRGGSCGTGTPLCRRPPTTGPTPSCAARLSVGSAGGQHPPRAHPHPVRALMPRCRPAPAGHERTRCDI